MRERNRQRAREGRRRSRRRRERTALRALTSSALGLAGIAGSASADSPVDRVQADYNYSTYREDELDASKGLPLAERDRYEIEMHQFSLRAPVPFTERLDFGVELVQETMSGASPWFIVPDAAGSPIQVMSGATIQEERIDLLLRGDYYYDDARIGLASGYSTENDYTALNASVDGEVHFNEKNTTLSGGLGISVDEIEPADVALFSTRPTGEDKQTYSLFTGLSQVIDRTSIIQSGLTYRHSRGYLADPYKQVFVVAGGTVLADARPDARNQLSWLTQYRRHIEEVNGTLHASYQFYVDDWDLTSHTFELAWHQSVRDALRIVPSLRYYTQSEADFYVPYLSVAPGRGAEHSSDYRLSAYGALTFGLQAEYDFRTRWTGPLDWRATVSWERYVSSADLALSDPREENPALVSFHVLTIGLSIAF